MNATDRAAREWFGYGSWSAPFWFVGMEPGGEGDDASHESWQRLGGGELIDCKAHHLDCQFLKWHGGERPPTQPTWRRLMQLLLAYKGEDTALDAVARYQRDHFGAADGETAVIELSAHHAVNMDVDVERMAHRDDRISLIRRRLDEHRPTFVVFYGKTYQSEYERVIGAPFGPGGAAWRDGTLCVLTIHPVAKSGSPPAYWVHLGQAMRTAVDAGPGSTLSVVDSAALVQNADGARAPATSNDYTDVVVVPIVRAGKESGRIVRVGAQLRVESREPDGSYRMLGRYEDVRAESTYARKLREIDDIFDAWRGARIGEGSEVKTIWRKRDLVPGYREQPGALTVGCSVVEDDGVPIAYVYKIPPVSAVWIDG